MARRSSDSGSIELYSDSDSFAVLVDSSSATDDDDDFDSDVSSEDESSSATSVSDSDSEYGLAPVKKCCKISGGKDGLGGVQDRGCSKEESTSGLQRTRRSLRSGCHTVHAGKDALCGSDVLENDGYDNKEEVVHSDRDELGVGKPTEVSEWCWVQSETGDMPEVPKYLEDEQPSIDHKVLPMSSSPIECFKCIYDESFFSKVADATDRHALANMAACDHKSWTRVTITDLYKFFSMFIHMCLIRRPSITFYFTQDVLLSSPFPQLIGMDGHKFCLILKHLHLAYHDECGKQDLSSKITPMINHLLKKFQIYRPGANLTIGETLYPYNGRVGFKVDLIKNLKKHGTRVELVVDTKTNAVCHMELRSGRTVNSNDFVQRLTKNFQGKNHRIYVDQRYSSPELFRKMLEHEIFCVGTVKKRAKNIPTAFNCKDFKR